MEDSWDLQDGTVEDLREAVVANLEHRGVMGKLRAKVISGSKRARAHRFLPYSRSPHAEDTRKNECLFLYGCHSIAAVDAVARTSVLVHSASTS